MVNIEELRRKLLKKQVDIYPQTLKVHGRQGNINQVFTIESNKGKLLLHISKHHAKVLQYEKAKRIFYLSRFLSKHPQIPVPEVLDFGKDSYGNVYTIQIFVEGEGYSQEKGRDSHLRHLAQIIAQLHQIEMPGAGYIIYKNNRLDTTHQEWCEFLLDSSYKSLKGIYDSDLIQKEEYLEVKSKIKMFFEKYRKFIEGQKGKLLHSDLNLGNVLIGDQKINALIDMEFSCAGDPAFEFSAPDYLKGIFLDNYFEELKKLGLFIDEDNFRFRMKIYDPIKRLIATNYVKKNC